MRSDRILTPGRNCGSIDQAHRAYCIQDAAEYFALVQRALLEARRSVFVLGWDIAASLDLLPDKPSTDPPSRLNKLLGYIARRRPELQVYVLIWDYVSVYTLERDPFTRLKLRWGTPRRVRFAFDQRHPVGGSHHQKVIVIDDALAFVGGIDLTTHRWDTAEHCVENEHRKSGSKPYGPYHEIHAMVDGPSAASLAKLARDRWRLIGVDDLPSISPSPDDLWPADVTPDFTDVPVAISRTIPAAGDQPAVRECETLFLDSIAAAKRSIYIESQYFTCEPIAEALGRRLREPDGPEIIVVTPKETSGWLEQQTVGVFRNRVCRNLLDADHHRRLRLVYPQASRAHDVATFIHSKVMIVDDEFARIGSANCSNRSMGVDTECDIAIEAGGEERIRAGVRRVRARLLGEHLGMTPEAAARALEESGSLREMIDRCQEAERCLVRVQIPDEDSASADALKPLADPYEPIGFGPAVAASVPAVEAAGRGPIRVWVLPVAALVAATGVVLAASATFRDSPWESIRTAMTTWPAADGVLAIGTAAFVMASLVLVPTELLVLATAVILGPVTGGAVAALGSLGAAVIGYAAGWLLGPDRIQRWMTRRSYRAGSRAALRGPLAIAMARLAGVGSAGSLHLICGANRANVVAFLGGSFLAMAPVVLALVGVGGLLRRTLLEPTLAHAFWTILAAVGLLAVNAATSLLLRLRQFSPVVSAQQRRAEFG